MHSFSTWTPTRRLVTGSKAAWLPPKASYLSSWTLVITCIRPCAPTGLWANGLKLDSTAMTARIRVGSSSARCADGPGFLDQPADRLGRDAIAARQPVGDRGLGAAQVLGSEAVARAIASGSPRSRLGVGSAARCSAGLVARLQPAQGVRLDGVAEVGAARRRTARRRPPAGRAGRASCGRPRAGRGRRRAGRRRPSGRPRSARSGRANRSASMKSWLSSSIRRPGAPAARTAAWAAAAIIPHGGGKHGRGGLPASRSRPGDAGRQGGRKTARF